MERDFLLPRPPFRICFCCSGTGNIFAEFLGSGGEDLLVNGGVDCFDV